MSHYGGNNSGSGSSRGGGHAGFHGGHQEHYDGYGPGGGNHFQPGRGRGPGRENNRRRNDGDSGLGRGPNKRHQGDPEERRRWETNGIQVVTNLFPLVPVSSGRVELNIYQFDIEIDFFRKKKRVEAAPQPESEKEVPDDAQPATQPQPERRPKRQINERSSPLSRRILLECQKQIAADWFFLTDGANIAYSVQNIPEKYDVTKFDDKEGAGIVVEVRDGSEEECTYAKYAATKKYVVYFKPVGESFRIVFHNGRIDSSCQESLPKFFNFMNQVLNNACMKAGMISTRKNPERYYFPRGISANVLGGNFQRQNESHPLLGLSQSVSIAVNGSMQIQSDFALGWFEPDVEEKPLLDPVTKKLAGENISDLHRPITDPTVQDRVRNALKPLLFHTRYERGRDWEACETRFLRRKLEGKENLEDFIAKQISKKREHRFNVQLNRRLSNPDKAEGADIIFIPSNFTFSFLGEEMTVEQYYRARYDVNLLYPHMPLICIHSKRQDYMPAEFLYHAFTQKKNANHDDQKRIALALCDQHSGLRRVNFIETLNTNVHEPTLREMLEKLQIRKDSRLTVAAGVLQEPDINTGSGKQPHPYNGSWSCDTVETGGVLHTLAVIDLTRRNESNFHDVKSLLEKCRQERIDCLRFQRDDIDRLTVSLPSNFPPGARVDLSLARVMAKKVRETAYQFFLYGGYNRPFKTTVRCSGKLKECVVVPFKGLPVFYFEEDRYTHQVRGHPRNTAEQLYAKLCFSTSSEAENLLDPFKQFDEVSDRFDQLYMFYHVETGDIIREIQGLDPFMLAVDGLSINPDDGMIDCPSIVIVRLKDKDAMQYSLLKYALYEAGLQTQCFVNPTKHNGFGVLTKNLAIKINAKLASPMNKSNSWIVSGPASQWLRNNDTLVIGYAFAGAQGKSGKMVVAASSCVDDEGLRMRHANIVLPKASYLTPVAVDRLISSLYEQYVNDREKRPKHLIVYRCNGQDTELEGIKENELKTFETIFRAKSSCRNDDNPELPPVRNPVVTFLVAQTLSSPKLAPVQKLDRGNNVPSGTCVTDPRAISQIITGSDGSNESSTLKRAERNYDFILVPQQGLKGTSKPVYYRVLKLGISGSQQAIKDVTYSLSFRYATATKVPRLPAVLLYSQRIAGVILACLPELKDPFEGRAMFDGGNDYDYFRRFPNQDPDRGIADHMVFTDIEGPTPFHPHLLA
ncbi:hypothetical protein FisN_9Lh322 [Fistulifera solaris]|uniref:Piwi domain-containing protein n=1 Tax=Fistulifera solaris TaxID=1519565 RepID=A0A1Z5KM40_FISSO|nr:hypothetical protein FisN_9Lh322 [Fistulifera solaris]|eukprot:GAX27008.1 hypothetical protein FisN_9Lh322 [Fistulifera solaris]